MGEDKPVVMLGSAGIGLGNALAMIISWELMPKLGWTIFHGIGGWIYIIFKLIDGTIHF